MPGLTGSGLLAYEVVMSFILFFGFTGNVLTLLVLRHPDHRSKTITPFMVNLAVADLCIILFGYPPTMSAVLAGRGFHEGQAECLLSGFANGTVGITSIACLTVMSLVMHHTIKATFVKRLSRKQTAVLIAGTWAYGILSMLPPVVGWNKFVAGAGQISCRPDWTDRSPAAISYNILLVLVGFVIPLTLISVCYIRIFRFLGKKDQNIARIIPSPRRKHQTKVVRMILMAVVAFVLSWTPFCIMSIVSMFRGAHVGNSGAIPNLFAKASAVLNPFVYVIMNDRFRSTLSSILSRRKFQSTLATRESRRFSGRRSTAGDQVQPAIQSQAVQAAQTA